MRRIHAKKRHSLLLRLLQKRNRIILCEILQPLRDCAERDPRNMKGGGVICSGHIQIFLICRIWNMHGHAENIDR